MHRQVSSKPFQCHATTPGPAACAHEQRRLIISIAITAITMLFEIAGGLLTGSLALLSDAGHMFSHLFALGVAYAAILLACRPPTEAQSFGFYRAEILAALANGLTLVVIAVWILVAAWKRLHHPEAVSAPQMLLVAFVGLAVNAVTALLLRDGAHHDLNLRGAFLHVLGDLGSSVGVVAAGIVIWFSGWTPADPIISALIALVILFWAGGLLRDAVRVLLQSTPRHLSHDRIIRELLEAVPAIRGVHHLHVWEMTSKMYVLTAHIEVEDMPLSRAAAIREKTMRTLAERFAILHASLELEVSGEAHTANP